MISIEKANNGDKDKWNKFVHENYPPVGAFMKSWEWGEFQKKLNRTVERFYVKDHKKIIGQFALIIYSLPFGFSYGYIPRGPILIKGFFKRYDPDLVFQKIKDWAKQNYKKLVFVRLEPPVESFDFIKNRSGWKIPKYYIQPKFNHVVDLTPEEENISKSFHPSTRANINKARNKGVNVVIKTSMTKEDTEHFFAMERDTIKRNSGKNAYPNSTYFDSLMSTILEKGQTENKDDLNLNIFFGVKDGVPITIHMVLFFAETATYIYGASYSKDLNLKGTTLLHYEAMMESRKKGFKYYDIGGVDDIRWPSLTTFKRQFRGKEFSYAGNIDIPIRGFLYKTYNLLRNIKRVE